MRHVFENIEANKLPDEMRRLGIPSHQRRRVIVETLDDGISLARMADAGARVAALEHERDLASSLPAARAPCCPCKTCVSATTRYLAEAIVPA